MKSEIKFKKWLAFIGGAAVIAFSLLVIFLPNEVNSLQSVILPRYPVSGLPIRLIIPKISVDAAIEQVGVAPDGSMDVPKGPQNVAWFRLGPRPGENGSAVIAGHYGWKDGIPAVFDTLSTLQKGDTLSVEDDTGVVTTFVVRESRLLGEHEDASEVFGSSDGKAHLNLITCEGVWNAATKSYSKRLVVFADKR